MFVGTFITILVAILIVPMPITGSGCSGDARQLHYAMSSGRLASGTIFYLNDTIAGVQITASPGGSGNIPIVSFASDPSYYIYYGGSANLPSSYGIGSKVSCLVWIIEYRGQMYQVIMSIRPYGYT
jgi:hypothetical protein